ncbi:MAG TPA: ferritin-like domain-containing protein [Allosphingosinicella sp.]
MLQAATRRYLDILASVYIYNEHRGYSSLDRVLEAVRGRCPEEREFISQVEKHRADERKHYAMFKRYFELRGYMPYQVDRTCGHIDRLIRLTFGCHIDDLDTEEVIGSDELFKKLCRIIMITEIRGMNTVDKLLHSFLLKGDRPLLAIFKVIERDEPSHWMPYRGWLQRHGGGQSRPGERLADFWVSCSLLFAKLPLLYFNPRLPRRTDWQDDHDEAIPHALAQAA